MPFPKGGLPRGACTKCGATVAMTKSGPYKHTCGSTGKMVCRGCGEAKPVEEFYVDSSRPRGRVARCKECYSETQSNVTRLKPYRRESEAKGSAAIRGIEWDLTREQFMFFWQKPCHYCGDEIQTVGLDRFDNKKGYTVENIVPCCGTCNRMKLEMSASEFLSRCEKIVARANASIACKGK
jgi:hypothetical protein